MRRGLLIVSLISAMAFGASLDSRLVDAAKHRDAAAVRSLLAQHVDVNQTAADGATALDWAAHLDDVETAKLLIAAGAKVGAANRYGMTPLMLACTDGSAAMVELLLSAKAD